MLKTIVGSIAVLGLSSSIAMAGECDVSIEATASMAYSAKEITVGKACKEVNLTL